VPGLIPDIDGPTTSDPHQAVYAGACVPGRAFTDR